jgi:hypothetical protein
MFENVEPRKWLEVTKEVIAVTERKMSFDTKMYENDIKRNALLEGRASNENDSYLIAQKNLDNQKAINAEWIKQLQSRGKIVADDTTELGFKFVGMSKEDEREVIDTLRNQKTEIDNSNLTLLQFKVDTALMTKEINERFKEMSLNDLTFKIQNDTVIDENLFGTSIQDLQRTGEALTKVINKSKSDIIKLEKEKKTELDLLGSDAAQEEIDKISVKYDNLINIQKTELEKQIGIDKTSKDALLNLTDIYYNRKIEKLQESLDKETEALEKKYDKDLSMQEKFISDWDKAKDNVKNDDIKNITDDEKAKLKVLEDSYNKQAISQEDYEARKKAISDKAQSEREQSENDFEKAQRLRDNLAKGDLLERERTQNLTMSKMKQDQIYDEMILLEQKRLDQGGTLSIADENQLKILQEEFDKVQEIINSNADIAGIGLKQFGLSLSTSMANVIAGDGQGAIDSLKGFLQVFSGVLQKGLIDLVDKKILEITLKALGLTPIDPVSLFIVGPALHTLVSAMVHGISDPLLKPLSFATGGRIDTPTALIAGDGSKLGSRNREWIFNDPQLIATVQMAAMGSNMKLESELKQIKTLLSTMNISTKLEGRDIKLSYSRTNIVDSRRARG